MMLGLGAMGAPWRQGAVRSFVGSVRFCFEFEFMLDFPRAPVLLPRAIELIQSVNRNGMRIIKNSPTHPI